jgi:hypothetical protein
MKPSVFLAIFLCALSFYFIKKRSKNKFLYWILILTMFVLIILSQMGF